nr:hypothetical protein [Sandaracinus sp.]
MWRKLIVARPCVEKSTTARHLPALDRAGEQAETLARARGLRRAGPMRALVAAVVVLLAASPVRAVCARTERDVFSVDAEAAIVAIVTREGDRLRVVRAVRGDAGVLATIAPPLAPRVALRRDRHGRRVIVLGDECPEPTLLDAVSRGETRLVLARADGAPASQYGTSAFDAGILEELERIRALAEPDMLRSAA